MSYRNIGDSASINAAYSRQWSAIHISDSEGVIAAVPVREGVPVIRIAHQLSSADVRWQGDQELALPEKGRKYKCDGKDFVCFRNDKVSKNIGNSLCNLVKRFEEENGKSFSVQQMEH